MAAGQHDVIVIGAGVNGLTCAAYLAKAGLKTLVLERQPAIGGCAQTGEIVAGFRGPLLAHTAGPLRRDVVDHLRLTTCGLEFVPGESSIVALGGDDRPLLIGENASRTAELLRAWSAKDADQWPRFVASVAAIGRVIGTLYASTPPPIDNPGGRDLWSLLRTLRAFRALKKPDAYRLLRWGPMAVADLVGESFETERLRAAVATDGIFGAHLGPWSAGSGLLFLLRAANEAVAAPRTWIARGGPGAIAAALERALTKAGGEVRTNAPVARIVVRDERARGVVLADGTELPARTIVSAADPRQTLLQLCDPIDLAPEFLWRMRRYRSAGTVAKINLALAGQPSFRGVAAEAMGGRVRICPDVDYLERAFDHAKYGRYSAEPYLEITIPSVIDPGLAPKGAHVLSAYVQFAPYALRGTDWDRERDAFAARTIATIEQHAPGLRALIVGQQVITPLDLERTYGLTGGHIFHGELALDQMLSMRPLLGWAHYQSPIRDLHLCSSGTHPGTGLTGGSGANAAREILRSR